MAATLMAWGQPPSPHISADADQAQKDLNSCHVYEVKSLPGSHQFAADFLETMATDPNPDPKDPYVVWGLTADLSDEVPAQDRALYISKSTNGGQTWTRACATALVSLPVEPTL
jgi:hypothetical protein